MYKHHIPEQFSSSYIAYIVLIYIDAFHTINTMRKKECLVHLFAQLPGKVFLVYMQVGTVLGKSKHLDGKSVQCTCPTSVLMQEFPLQFLYFY